jgi:hypothetical protein
MTPGPRQTTKIFFGGPGKGAFNGSPPITSVRPADCCSSGGCKSTYVSQCDHNDELSPAVWLIFITTHLVQSLVLNGPTSKTRDCQ